MKFKDKHTNNDIINLKDECKVYPSKDFFKEIDVLTFLNDNAEYEKENSHLANFFANLSDIFKFVSSNLYTTSQGNDFLVVLTEELDESGEHKGYRFFSFTESCCTKTYAEPALNFENEYKFDADIRLYIDANWKLFMNQICQEYYGVKPFPFCYL